MPSAGQPVNEQYTELLSVGPFGGLDTTTEPFFVAPSNFVSGSNFVPNAGYGGFVTAKGRLPFLAAPLQGRCWGMHRIRQAGQPDMWLFAVEYGTVMLFYSAVQGGVATIINTTPHWQQNTQVVFADSLHWVFISNGVNTPVKYDILTGLMTNWGMTSPTTAPLLAFGPASTMNGTYHYTITFGNAVQESSQGVVSLPITVSNTGVLLTSIPTASDSQVRERNIYRIGGSLGQWRLVGTINDNSTTTYSDTLGDDQITGQLLTVFRDPPAPFTSIVAHKERIWGFGTPSDPSIVYYSNYGEPWGFNNLTGNFPVGENSFGDGSVGMASIGTQLVLFKNRTIYNITGSNDADFQVNKLFDIGCKSAKSICTAYGVCWWISRQGIYQYDGSSPQNISDGNFQASNIKTILDGFSSSTDLIDCTSFVYDRMVHFCFPTVNQTFLFDLRAQGWYPLNWAADQVDFDIESDIPIIGTNLQTVGQIDQWFAAPGDFGGTIDSFLISRITDSGNIHATKEYRYLELQAPVQNGQVVATVIIDPGTLQITDTQAFDLSSGFTRQQLSLKKGMSGAEVQIKLLIRAAATIHIQKAAVFGYEKALFRGAA